LFYYAINLKIHRDLSLKIKWKYSIPAIIILLVIAIAAYKITTAEKEAGSRRQMAPLVKVEKPTRELIKIQLQFNGDVLPIRQASIFSKVSGNLERIYVDMGSTVRANQLLASIDSTELYQQYQQTSATYQNARMTFGRVQQLLEKSLASKQDLDNADAAMKVAKANFDAASTRLSYSCIVAPFGGTITKRFLDPGALITANNTTLYILMNIDSVKIVVNVPEKDVPSVYQIRIAQVTLDALPSMEFKGKVTRFSEAIDLSTRTMAVQVEVSNRSHIIKPGMFATIQMTIDEHQNAITVPTNALLKDETGPYIFAINDKKAKRIRVQTGAEQGEHTEIISGLTGDETIITVGQQFVKDDGLVTIQQ
jgi:membrane fusion protein (multidrug efflux system)